MSTHLSMVTPGTPAIDYEKVKEFFFSKLAGDLYGRGRMESALFHTAQWIFLQGCHEREQLLERVAALEDDNAILRQALATTGQGAAELLQEAGARSRDCFSAHDMASQASDAWHAAIEAVLEQWDNPCRDGVAFIERVRAMRKDAGHA